MMSHFFHTLGLLLMVLPLAAQMPDWCNAASRKMHYPPEKWYTGYVEGQQQKGETLEDAMARLKDAARVELVSSIRTTVEQNISNYTESDLKHSSSDFNEQIRESFVNETHISTGIRDIPGLQVEIYRHQPDGMIAAFAYVKRATLSNQLVKRITLGLAKAEIALEQAETLLTDGQKSESRLIVEKGLQQMREVEDAQSLLSSVDETADDETLQYTAAKTLRHQLNTLSVQLKNAIMVYIECKADLFGGQYPALLGKIKGELSSMGVSYSSSQDMSDWAIYVTATAREYNSRQFGNVNSYTAYVEAIVAVEKAGQRVYEEQLDSEKGTHTISFVEAAREAYKKISPLICEKIKAQLE